MKLSGIKTFVTDKAKKATESVTALAKSEGTKAVIQRSKDGASAAAHGVVDIGKRTAHSVNTFVEHENTVAAAAWTKKTVVSATDDVMVLGKRAANSEMGKDAATGAAIGATVAIPIPLVGPIFGAIVGAGAGIVMNIKKGDSRRSAASDIQPSQPRPDIDIHKKLTDLDDLRQKGILSQEEFDYQKNILLKPV